MVDAPDELSLAFVFLTDDDGSPAVAIAGMHAGSLEAAEAALAPIREAGPALDAFAPTPYAAFQSSLDDPPGYRNWWTAEYLDDLGARAIDAICALAEELPAGPAQIFIPAWGGAIARVPDGETPLTGRSARFVVHPLLLWEDPAEDERTIAYGRRWREVLAPYRTGATYLNFTGDEGHGPRARGLRPALRAPRAREGRVGPGQRLPRHRQRATHRLGKPLMCSRPRAGSIALTTSPESPRSPTLTTTQRWTLAVVCAATAMLMLDIAVVNTALSDIAADLNTGLSGLQWVVDAYTLALAAVVLTAGSLADRIGRRVMFTIGLSIFTVTSLACAAASDIVMLNASRAVQGIGAAIMFACSLALLSNAFRTAEERAKAFAAYGAAIGASFAVGPLVGGALTSGLDWRFIFLVNLPLGLLCIGDHPALRRGVEGPERPPHRRGPASSR